MFNSLGAITRSTYGGFKFDVMQDCARKVGYEVIEVANAEGIALTKEMLEAYGCNTLVLTKTDQKTEDENGELLDVWFLSFEATQEQEDEE